MNPIIKQRIEQIKSGQVPTGYKKTKLGIFPEEWGENKLSHYLEVSNEKNTDLKYDKQDVFSISGELGIVNQIELLGRSYAGVSVAPYGVVNPNDVVYTKSPLKSSPYGIIKTNLSNKSGIVSTLYAIFKCKNNVCPKFIQDYFSLDLKLNNYLYPLVNIGAKHDMKISDENSLKGFVIFPSLYEQEKIAKILETQDKIIELYRRKIEKLQKLKKSYLSKMFPKHGSNVPEIRFPGFTEAWEQRKLGDCVDFLDTLRKPLEGTKRVRGPYPYYGASGIVDYVDGYLFDEELVLLSEDGANITERNYPVSFLIAGKCWVNNHAHVLRTKQNYENNFICNSLERKDYTQYNTGMAMPKLNQEMCRNIPVMCPQYAEQKRIGDYFRSLDSLITLHQHKLEEMKKYKKALMQLLLTGIVRV